MADGLFNVEILVRMSQNVRAKNEGWRKDVWHEGQERWREATALRAMFEQEYANLDQECKRLEQYAPRQEPKLTGPEPLSKVAQKGPVL